MTEPPARPSSLRKRRAILVAAADVFLARGYPGTSMDDIAVQAGVSKQTIYTHFGSKEQLFLAIVEAITEQANAGFETSRPPIETIDDLRGWLIRYARAQLEIVMTPEIARVRRLAITELAHYPDFARHFYDAGPARTVELVAPVLARASENGLIEVADPRRAAQDFNWLLMAEPIMRSLLLAEDDAPTPEQVTERAEAVVETILRAYRPAG